MQLKTVISRNENLNQMIHLMQFHTPMGRTALLQRGMMTCSAEIEDNRTPLDNLMNASSRLNEKNTETINHLLNDIRNIHTTLSHLQNGQKLDEIALFEIKTFAITIEKINEQLQTWPSGIVTVPSLISTIDLLDPDGQRIKSFFIYDSYSIELCQLRKKVQDLKDKIERTDVESQINDWQQQISNHKIAVHELENKILAQLSNRLRNNVAELNDAFFAITQLDILLAQKRLNEQLNLIRPSISCDEISYDGLFHPLVKATMLQKEQLFQPISITLQAEVTVLTGANMSGKSVLLQSMELAQLMFQYGFYVPALSAKMVPVHEIFLLQGDHQNSQQGLSSFGAEVLQISTILKSVHQNKTILALLDEPARTTNPAEGESLVDALVDQLQRPKIYSLVATHYGSLQTPCRRIKTKGLRNTNNSNITLLNINQYLDYSLEEIGNNEVPHEALRIADLLGAEPTWIEKAREKLQQRKNNSK